MILRAPQSEWRVLRNPLKVDVRREHQEFVSNAELSIERIDGSNLHTFPPARISQPGRGNMVFPIRNNQGKGGEPIHNGLLSLWTCKSLKKLLEDQARGENRFARLKGLLKPTNWGTWWWSISTQGQRLDVRIDKKAH